MPTFGWTPVGTDSRSTASLVHSAAISPDWEKDACAQRIERKGVGGRLKLFTDSVTPTTPLSSPLRSLSPSGDHSSHVTSADACALGICTITLGDPPLRSTPGRNSTTLSTPVAYGGAPIASGGIA